MDNYVVPNGDANNYNLVGIYWAPGADVAHMPASTGYYFLLAFGCVQIACRHSSGIPDFYIRDYTNSQWYSWKKVATTTP